jgi:hypothetical protein
LIDCNVLGLFHVKLTAIALIVFAAVLSAQSPAPAANPSSIPKVRLVVGLDGVKGNASGTLAVQEGTLRFRAGKAAGDIAVSTIDDIFIGAEVTQSGGKTGRAVKTAAIAAPFGSGKALTIMMRTKVDILTVEYHDADGAVHGAIFALPKGQAGLTRDQLVQAGAHASPVAEVAKP